MRRRKDYKYIDHHKIGTVFFEKSDRAKRVVIYVKSPDFIRVAVPRHISIKKAEKFVEMRIQWINKNQLKLNNKNNLTDNISKITKSDKENLIQRVEYLAGKYNFKYNKLTLRKMTSKWGSCTRENNISLNIGLIFLTDELRDYVILHELIHTKVKSHGPKFWNELSKIIPNAKKLAKMLNQNYRLDDN